MRMKNLNIVFILSLIYVLTVPNFTCAINNGIDSTEPDNTFFSGVLRLKALDNNEAEIIGYQEAFFRETLNIPSTCTRKYKNHFSIGKCLS